MFSHHRHQFSGFVVLTAVPMNRDMTACALIDVYRRFGITCCVFSSTCCLAYSSALKMERVHSCETYVNFYQSTRSHISQDTNIDNLNASKPCPLHKPSNKSHFNHEYHYLLILILSVGIATSYGFDDSGIGVPWHFSLLHSVQTSSGAHPASYPMGTGGSFPGVKSPGSEADHPHPYSAEVKTGGPPLPHTSLWRRAKLIKPKDNFSLEPYKLLLLLLLLLTQPPDCWVCHVKK
jgi:hypothetical protein